MPTSPPPSRAGGDLGHITDHGTIRTVLLELQAGTSTYKGAWAAATAYAVGDEVTSGGSLWAATTTHSAASNPTFVQASDSGSVSGGTTLSAHGSAVSGNKQLLYLTTHQSYGVPATPSGWTLVTSVVSTHDRVTVWHRDVTAGNIGSSVVVAYSDWGRAVMRTYTASATPVVSGSGTGLVDGGYVVNGILVRAWGSAESSGSSGPPTKTLTTDAALTNATGPATYVWFSGLVTGDDPTASGSSAPSRTATNTGGGSTFPLYVDVMLTAPGSFSATGWQLMVGGGAPIGFTSYAPGSLTALGGFTAEGDLDATNLLVTFTVPPSGQVIVVLTGTFYTNAAGVTEIWSLREGGSRVTGSAQAAGSPGSNYTRGVTRCRITGLTPGDTKTWKWGVNSMNGVNVYFAYAPDGATSVGPAIMEVYAA